MKKNPPSAEGAEDGARGIVVDSKSPQTGRYLVVHNIGRGPQMEDVLFSWKITGHYRYFGPGLSKK